MSLTILKPGLMTSVQDRGRYGLQHLGVVPSGPMDPVALDIANALVGNQGGEAALEITLIGPEIVFGEDALVALAGAELPASAGGSPFPLDRPVRVDAGTRLVTGRAARGSRAYLAVAGGIAVEPVLGSRGTCLPAGFGGVEGRALRAGDVLPLAPDAARLAAERYARLAARAGSRPTVRWSAPAFTLPERETILVHAMPGRHHRQFDARSQREFFETRWKISPDSNRMGFRLAGATLVRGEAREILSEPTCLGTVQVPQDGAPIVLMADHQTTGGYPRFAEVAGADMPRLAQLAPGSTLRFARCSLEEALELRRSLRLRLEALLRAIAWEYGT